jgi:hypothetical protein
MLNYKLVPLKFQTNSQLPFSTIPPVTWKKEKPFVNSNATCQVGGSEGSWKVLSKPRHGSCCSQEWIVKWSWKYLDRDSVFNSNHFHHPDIQEGQGKPQIPSCGFAILKRKIKGSKKVHILVRKVLKINQYPLETAIKHLIVISGKMWAPIKIALKLNTQIDSIKGPYKYF